MKLNEAFAAAKGPVLNWPLLSAAALTVMACLIGPWWSVAVPAAALGFCTHSLRRAIAIGAGGGALAWTSAALARDILSGGRLSARIGGVLQAPVAPLAAYLMTAAVAVSVAALAAWAGYAVRDFAFSRARRN